MNLDTIQQNASFSLTFDSPARLVSISLRYIYAIAGIILIIMIITSGYQMMLSKGDPKALQIAQGKLTTSIMGILILFLSFFIVKLIMQFLGINLTTPIL